MPKLPRSSAFRVAASFSASFALFVLALGGVIYWELINEVRRDFGQPGLTDRATPPRNAVGGNADLARASGADGSEPGYLDYAVVNTRGRPIVERTAVRSASGWREGQFVTMNVRRADTRAETRSIAGRGTMVVGSDSQAIEEAARHILPVLAAGFGLIALIGTAGAFVISYALRFRIDLMTSKAEAIMAGGLTTRMRLSGNGDEFDRLSSMLNRMFERIATLVCNFRQVSGDVAHDLRTPLSRVRQRLEAAATGPDDARTLKVAIVEAIKHTDGTLALLTTILDIAEIEASGVGVQAKSFDLSALITDLADSYQPAAEDAGRNLTRDVSPGIEIKGNRELIARAGSHLLDNALRHTPEGTAIDVSLTRNDDALVIMVSDCGPGIPLEKRAWAFGRFARLETSRSTPGHGLGLSLVAAIARAHGGTATLHDNHPGAKVMVTLPGDPR